MISSWAINWFAWVQHLCTIPLTLRTPSTSKVPYVSYIPQVSKVVSYISIMVRLFFHNVDSILLSLEFLNAFYAVRFSLSSVKFFWEVDICIASYIHHYNTEYFHCSKKNSYVLTIQLPSIPCQLLMFILSVVLFFRMSYK
jgi:hypothetical protein